MTRENDLLKMVVFFFKVESDFTDNGGGGGKVGGKSFVPVLGKVGKVPGMNSVGGYAALVGETDVTDGFPVIRTYRAYNPRGDAKLSSFFELA